MKVSLDNRSTFVRLIERMSDMDVRQMLAYATGYEAGKISQPTPYSEEQSRNPTKQLVNASEQTNAFAQLSLKDFAV